MTGRDRDAVGRARNARPRDGLGRPLPYGAVGVERAPEGVVRTPAQTVAQAQQLIDAGKPFHAHEVFEDAWKSAADDRALWKALAQLAVGLTHAARGNERGRVALLERARTGLRVYAGRTPYGIDVDGLVMWIDAALAGGTPAPPQLTGARSDAGSA